MTSHLRELDICTDIWYDYLSLTNIRYCTACQRHRERHHISICVQKIGSFFLPSPDNFVALFHIGDRI